MMVVMEGGGGREVAGGEQTTLMSSPLYTTAFNDLLISFNKYRTLGRPIQLKSAHEVLRLERLNRLIDIISTAI